MTATLFFCACILLLCIAASRVSDRFGIPVLLLFMLLGMLCGSDGVLGIHFAQYDFAEQICSLALVFIMFYGGFGVNWHVARPVAAPSILLASLGVVLTSAFTGLFCHFALGTSLLEGLLIGSVIGSTDAASVFSILRFKNLNLKGGLASLVEIESGSNDPTSYMLTVLILSLISPGDSVSFVPLLLKQVGFGLLFGAGVGLLAGWVLKRVSFGANGLQPIFVIAVALLAYAAPSLLGGNGYLSVYLAGILIGNQPILHKVELVHFFDGLTGLMQILLFFLLGLLSFPSQMPAILLPAVAVFVFMTFVSRPAAVALLLTPFRVPFRHQLFIAFSGLRGAASIVFAILAVISPAYMSMDIFHIVFCICLLSVCLQGTFLPLVAKKLGLVETDGSVLKTFNDYQDDSTLHLMEITVTDAHPFAGRELCEIPLPPEQLVVMVKRGDNTLIPRGHTRVHVGDRLIVSVPAFRDDADLPLGEMVIEPTHPFAYRTIDEVRLPPEQLIVAIKRGDETVVPRGQTQILPGDILVYSKANASTP